jgi:hypothetical protein
MKISNHTIPLNMPIQEIYQDVTTIFCTHYQALQNDALVVKEGSTKDTEVFKRHYSAQVDCIVIGYL